MTGCCHDDVAEDETRLVCWMVISEMWLLGVYQPPQLSIHIILYPQWIKVLTWLLLQ